MKVPKLEACGYSLVPPMWIGEKPLNVGLISASNVGVLGHEVLRRQLNSGLIVSVRKGSSFCFDFAGWKPGASIAAEVPPSDDRISQVVLNRVAVLNAHLACLYTVLWRKEKRAPSKQVIEGPRHLLVLDSIEPNRPASSIGTTSEIASLTYVLAGSAHHHPMLTPQGQMRVTTVEESLILLDDVLSHPEEYAVQLADLYLRAARHYEERGHSLAVSIAWTITEKLLRKLWLAFLESRRSIVLDGEQVPFITKKRREKLTGNDYTASIICETLSLAGVLELPLYRDIDAVRVARNKWLHGFESPSAEMTSLALAVCRRMLLFVENIDLELHVFQVGAYGTDFEPEQQ